MNNTILIDGIRYHKDRPASCRQCYFWKNRKVGCTLGKENCYYLAESTKKKSPCEGCCYFAALFLQVHMRDEGIFVSRDS